MWQSPTKGAIEMNVKWQEEVTLNQHASYTVLIRAQLQRWRNKNSKQQAKETEMFNLYD